LRELLTGLDKIFGYDKLFKKLEKKRASAFRCCSRLKSKIKNEISKIKSVIKFFQKKNLVLYNFLIFDI